MVASLKKLRRLTLEPDVTITCWLVLEYASTEFWVHVFAEVTELVDDTSVTYDLRSEVMKTWDCILVRPLILVKFCFSVDANDPMLVDMLDGSNV